MNKKGFTLMEILVVITIISIATAIVGTSIVLINNNSKKRINDSKMDLILMSAKEYAKDHKNIFDDNNEATINIDDLLKRKYLESEIESGDNCSYIYGCILNENDEIINNYEITLIKTSNSINASFTSNIIVYNINIDLNSTGLLNNNVRTIKNIGENKYIIVPNEDYSLNNPTINCNDLTYKYDETTGTLYVANATSNDASCSVTLKNSFIVSVEVNHGISNMKYQSVEPGGSKKFEIISDVGYDIDNPVVECDEGINGSIDHGILTVSNVTTSGTCNISLGTNRYLSAVAIQGQYVDYVGANGCPNLNACKGCNAYGGSSYNDGTPGSKCNTTEGYCYLSRIYNAYGWRVAYIDRNSTPTNYSDDSVYIVTGGSPECNGYYYSSLTDLNVAALKYCNSNYVYNGTCNDSSTWNINETDFQKILGSNITLYACHVTATPECGSTNPLIAVGGFHWYANPAGNNGLWHFTGYYPGVNENGYSMGIRPVVRLATGIIHDGTGNGTQATPYKLITSY